MSNLLNLIIEGAQDKKARNILSIDMTEVDGAVCNHFVVCNAESTTQVSAIAESIEDVVRKQSGERVLRVEGKMNSFWVVMDYGDILVHIFQTEMRDFYKLEELWKSAPVVKYESEE